LAQGAGVLVMLGLACLVVWGVARAGRWLGAAGGEEGAPSLSSGSSAEPSGERAGSGTRVHARAWVVALLVVVALAALGLLLPWAVAVRELGAAGLLGLLLLVVPPALGLLHAVARGPLEW